MEKILLHTCCAPCGVAVIEELKKSHAVTVFFYNPNIQPRGEYEKRKREVVRVCEGWNIPIVDGDYLVEEWAKEIVAWIDEPEGGERCKKCFLFRLEKTASYAREWNFDAFASTLTSGRNKFAEVINPLGEALAREYGLIFLAIDWKKGGRQERGKEIIEEMKIYRQNYCGCIFGQKSVKPATPKRSEAGHKVHKAL